MKYILIILTLATVGLWAYNLGAITPHVTTTNNDAVQSVCDYSHKVDSGAWEEACGLAQDSTHTEYLCDKLGVHCWVENK